MSSVQKKYGSNDFKAIASYEYDDMGRLKTKHLDPGYTGSDKNELEALTYSYNLHNNITGINKDYALKTPGKYDKWGNFFGLYLGFDNRDGVFTSAQLNGQVAGLLWNTQGDDAQRKYEYTYDNAGRLINAAFKEKQTPGEAWSNSKMDFSVSGRNGKIEYDLNGNLLFMSHKGVLPGSTAPVLIDDLQYFYTNATTLYGNKLFKVTDNSTLGADNGKFGDFKDGSNGTADDYVYDDNGNLVIDLNKNVKEWNGVGSNGIVYNYLDKPEQIKIAGKGTIKIVYDATGNKLQRSYTPEGTTNTTTTTYINEFVYQGDALQYINFEEGRIRVMQPVSQTNGYDALTIDGNMTLPNGKKGVYDYYIRDYQENVRMILTEEVHAGSNQCTMETTRASNEEPLFGQAGAGNEVATTRFAVNQIPGQTTGGGWQNADIGSSVSRLSKLTKKTGPNVLLKVMAGDQLSAMTQYYYQNAVVNGTGSTLVNDVVTSLVQAITGSPVTNTVTKEAANNISTQLNDINNPIGSLVAPDVNNTTGTNPKAYMTVIFFDERFNYVGEGSTFRRVGESPGPNASLVIPEVKAPKNGYAFVYLSNESDEYVYFDNFQVTHNRGRIIEENHYYAYGLKIAAISSKKLGDVNEGGLDNKYLYNDKELFDDADLNWYDYGFRNYDPQIGRFTQLDPLADDYPYYTPYQYAGCEPIANVDLDGLEPLGKIMDPITITSTTRTAAQGVSLSNAAASVTLNFTVVFKDVYTNSRGHSYVTTTPSSGVSPSTQHYLGEDWTFSGTKMTLEQVPYTGPTISPAKQNKVGFIGRLYNHYTSPLQMIQNPVMGIALNTLNDVYVGGKTMFAVGSDKLRVTDLGGNPTSRDQRFWAGVSTLAIPMTAGLGSLETSAAKRGTNIVGTAYDKIKPTQDWINPAKVDEYKSLLQSGRKLDPIIGYKNARGIFIEDGHHRFAAYMELGLKPNMIIRNTGGPVGFPNWLSTTFQAP